MLVNHPSGYTTPSEAEIRVTRDLIRGGQLRKLEVLDHVVMGHGQHSSLRRKLWQTWTRSPTHRLVGLGEIPILEDFFGPASSLERTPKALKSVSANGDGCMRFEGVVDGLKGLPDSEETALVKVPLLFYSFVVFSDDLLFGIKFQRLAVLDIDGRQPPSHRRTLGASHELHETP
jgi:hypothetical protein